MALKMDVLLNFSFKIGQLFVSTIIVMSDDISIFFGMHEIEVFMILYRLLNFYTLPSDDESL